MSLAPDGRESADGWRTFMYIGRIVLYQLGERRRTVKLVGYAHATQVVQDFVRSRNLGSSQLPPDFGDIVDSGMKRIAKVSYNGRVWDMDDRLIRDIHGGYPISADKRSPKYEPLEAKG
jgi:hypothetical protein